VLQAAQTMRDARVSSSLLLLKDEHLIGLVTDRDLRNRALAAGLDPACSVMEIATLAPLCVDLAPPRHWKPCCLMARHNVHHVPVLDGQRVAGMVTATDLAERHTTSAVYLVGEIHKQADVPGLVESASRVKGLATQSGAGGRQRLQHRPHHHRRHRRHHIAPDHAGGSAAGAGTGGLCLGGCRFAGPQKSRLPGATRTTA
jgi:signal-transduction protein with cAMP-binding, CBS, and nucleotidyltransferase domain